MARDAQLAGDRVQTEYYLQFADHYFRVLSESRARFEEQNPRRQRDDELDDEDGDEEMMEADGDSEASERDERQEHRAAREALAGPAPIASRGVSTATSAARATVTSAPNRGLISTAATAFRSTCSRRRLAPTSGDDGVSEESPRRVRAAVRGPRGRRTATTRSRPPLKPDRARADGCPSPVRRR